MKKVFLVLILAAAVIQADGQDKQNIERCFNTFKSAFSNQDIEKILEQIDEASIVFLNDMIKKTKAADSSSIVKLEAFEQMLILSTRILASREEIQGMNAQKLLKFYLKNRLYGTHENIDLGDITVDKGKAKAQMMSQGQAYDFYLFFSKEKNSWKYYLNSPIAVERVKLQKILEGKTMTEQQFVLIRVKRITDKDVTSNTWKPVN